MRTINATHTINCNAETYWKVFLDEAFTKALILEELGFKQFEVLEKTETTRRLRIVPKLTMPKAVQKLLGDSFGYEEVAMLDRDKNTWTWHIEPNTLAGKLFTSGVFRLEPAGQDSCRRIDEAKVEAKVFGLGKIIESSTDKQVREAFDTECAFMNRWLSKL